MIPDSQNPLALSNQGIELYNSQNYGLALAKFYQAKRILPRNKIINDNLTVVEDDLQLRQPVLVTYNFLNLSESLLLLLVFSLLFVFRKIITRHHLVQFGFIVLFIFSSLITAAIMLEQRVQKYAVIVEPSVKAYSGNNENSAELYELVDGQILQIIRKEKSWSQISYDNQLGWIRNISLEFI